MRRSAQGSKYLMWLDLTSVLDAISVLSPVRFVTVNQDEHGIMLLFGNVHKKLTSKNGMFGGVHMYPGLWLSTVHKLPNNEQVLETEYQSLVTSDGKEITMTLNIKYVVEDVERALLAVNDYEDDMSVYICTAIADIVSQTNFRKFHSDQRDILNSVHAEMNTLVRPWGINILSVGFNNLTTAAGYRLLSDALMR